MKRYDKNNRFIEHFDYLEFIEHCRTGEKPDSQYDASDNIDKSFYGTKDYNESERFAKYGWDAGLDKLKSEEVLEINGNIKITYGLSGGQVDVSRFLSGEPKYMISHVDEIERNKENMTVLIPLAYNCSFSVEQGLEFTMSVLKIVNELQRDYNIQVIGLYDVEFSDHNKKSTVSIVLKKYNEPLVLNSLAFSIHPGFFRRIYFRWIELQTFCEYGYGKPIANKGLEAIHEYIQDWINWLEINEYYLLPCLSSDNKVETMKKKIIKKYE